MVWRYVPPTTSIFRNGKFYRDVPITQTVIHPPTTARTHPGSGTRGDWYGIEMRTPVGTSWQGFPKACIDATLRVAVDVSGGRERDEVVAKWKKAPKNPCGGALGRACRTRTCAVRGRR